MSKRLLVLVSAIALLAGTAVSDARSGSLLATSGTWTMTGDPNESITNGRSYAFSAPNDGLELGSGFGSNGISVFARPAGTSDLWDATFWAPTGQQLLPGVYSNARRFPDALHPGLDVGGAGHGCNQVTGDFTIIDVSYGPYGYLNSVHLTFEQHCEGFAAALRGEINLTGPPAPPELRVHVTVDATSGFDRADGSLQLHGTISCSGPCRQASTANSSKRRRTARPRHSCTTSRKTLVRTAHPNRHAGRSKSSAKPVTRSPPALCAPN